jgi:hypothetical protein
VTVSRGSVFTIFIEFLQNSTELSSNSMVGTYLEQGSSSSAGQSSDHADKLPQESTRGRHVSIKLCMTSVDCNFRETPSYHTNKSTHSKVSRD